KESGMDLGPGGTDSYVVVIPWFQTPNLRCVYIAPGVEASEVMKEHLIERMRETWCPPTYSVPDVHLGRRTNIQSNPAAPQILARTLSRSHLPKPPTGTRWTCDGWTDDWAGRCRKGLRAWTVSEDGPGASSFLCHALLHNIRNEVRADITMARMGLKTKGMVRMSRSSISRPADEDECGGEETVPSRALRITIQIFRIPDRQL
ncbi:hypothetical protein BDN67DRAFT_986264, partial [Paxillus ammoniavirescens]